MVASLLRVPVWVRVVAVVIGGGLLFGFLLTSATGSEISGVELLATGGVLGALVGVVLPAVAPELGVTRPEGRHLTSDERRHAVAASLRGPVPSDPELRDVALGLARNTRDEAEKRWPWVLAVSVVAVIFYLVLAFLTSWWWLLAAGLFALLPVHALAERRRAASRVESLEGVGATGG